MNKTTYLLICLIEEASEVIQRVCKALRFGLEEKQPSQNLNNRERLEYELSDFMSTLQALDKEGLKVYPGPNVDKRLKIEKYMAYSQELRILEPDEYDEFKEYQILLEEFRLSSYGDRPQSMAVAKLKRLIELEAIYIQGKGEV